MTSSGMQGFLVSSSLDHTAKVFDLVTGRPVYNIISATGITSVACNSMGSQVFLGNSNGTVNIVNLLPHPPPGDVQVSGVSRWFVYVHVLLQFRDDRSGFCLVSYFRIKDKGIGLSCS